MKKILPFLLLVFAIPHLFIACHKVNDPQEKKAKWEVVNLNYTGDIDNIFALPNDTIMLISRYDDTFQKTCIFESDDAAKTWKQNCFDKLDPGGFREFYCFNHSKIYCGPFRTHNGGNSWQGDAFNGAPVHFFNDSVGFYIIGSSIYKTTDGGLTADIVFDQTTYEGFQYIQFFDKRIGYASGGTSFDSYNSGVMVKTTDGGNTWHKLPKHFKSIIGMSFVTEDIGFIVIDLHEGSAVWTTLSGSELLKTTDGGITWSSIYKKTENYHEMFSQCYFSDEQHGFLLGAKIFSTSNGGKSWITEYESTSTDYVLSKMIFTSAETGYAIGNNGLLLKRTLY